jgi:hypothetical protein
MELLNSMRVARNKESVIELCCGDLTDINGHLKDKPAARTEMIHWKGALDEEVEGLLYFRTATRRARSTYTHSTRSVRIET